MMPLASSPWASYIAPAAAFLASWLVLRYLLHSGLVLDYPNARSLHQRPVPRTGGIAIMAGVLSSALLIRASDLFPIWGGVILLLLVSVSDDVFGLPAVLRFAAHFFAAAIFLMFLATPFSVGWAIVAAIAIVWMTNLYNFMDGSDGLAGGMTLFGFGFYALAAWRAGNGALALSGLSVALAAGAFLRFNFHPAKIFMGDAGSIPIGFIAAGFGLIGFQQGDWPLWFPCMVFSPFMADASVTLVKRLLRGEKVWQAHRRHYYQRLVQIGWGHRNTALIAYALMLASGVTAIAALDWNGMAQAWLIAAWGAIYLGLMSALDRCWRNFSGQQEKSS